MEKDMIFFAENGLTSTHANTICNYAKEWITNLEALLNSVNFISEEVALIGNVASNKIKEGTSKDILDDTLENLNIIAKAKSLIAWLREAIKARSSLMLEINNTSIEEWAKSNNIELPIKPIKEECLNKDTYLSNLSIKERNRYYELENLCAVIGKYIHPGGTLSNARKYLNDKILHPHDVSGTGRDVLIFTYTPTVKASDVEDTFFLLQSKHREAQSELNGLKYKMEIAINTDATEKQVKYVEKMAEYQNSMNTLQEQFALWKRKSQTAIQNLKIVIPNSLTDIYNKVNELGKRK